MKTRIALTLAATLALWSAAAPAALKNVENAYESEARQVTLPANPRGQVVIRACTGCKPVVLRVDDQTRYLVGAMNPPVSLAELRAAAAADGADKRLVTIFYNLESGIVTRIVLSAG